MKKDAKRFYLLVVAFVLMTQVFALAPVAHGTPQGNKRTYMKKIPPPMQPTTNTSTGQDYRCRRSCRRQYNRCLYWAGTNRGRRRACAVRYRNCLKRCD